MRRAATSIALLALALPALAQLPARELLDDLDRLAYDARSAGMGGAAVAVEGLVSAPATNAATLAVGGDYRLGLAATGRSPQVSPLDAMQIFTAAHVTRIKSPANFNALARWADRFRDTPIQAELTMFAGVGEGRWRLYGTKGAIGSATLTHVTDSTGDHLTIRGLGTEYETQGIAYGAKVDRDLWLGIAIREARWYRTQMNFRADRATDGSVTVDETGNNLSRGLRWGVDLSAYHRASHSVAWGAALRHATAPPFEDINGHGTWNWGPSLDLGFAYHKPDSRSLWAADVRNILGSNGCRPVLKIGYERDLSHEGRWRARAGINDGRMTLGLGWHAPDGGADLAFGPNPAHEVAFSASFRF